MGGPLPTPGGVGRLAAPRVRSRIPPREIRIATVFDHTYLVSVYLLAVHLCPLIDHALSETVLYSCRHAMVSIRIAPPAVTVKLRCYHMYT